MSKPVDIQDATGTVLSLPGVGILFAYGTTVPSSAAGYAVGCYFAHIDGSGDTSAYVNTGTATSCTFTKISNIT